MCLDGKNQNQKSKWDRILVSIYWFGFSKMNIWLYELYEYMNCSSNLDIKRIITFTLITIKHKHIKKLLLISLEIVTSNFICMKKFLAWWWWSGWWGWCWWEYGWDGKARRPHAEARCRMTSNFHTMAKHHSDPTRLGTQ